MSEFGKSKKFKGLQGVRLGLGTGSRALSLLSGYLFRTWDLHKIFAEVPAFTLEVMHTKVDRLSEVATGFEVEATLGDYLYYDGKMWDMYIVSLSAARWRERTERASPGAGTTI